MSDTKPFNLSSLPEVFGGVQCGLIFTDRRDEISYANEKAEEILGASLGELLGRPVSSLLPPSTPENSNFRITTVMDSKVVLFSVPFALGEDHGGNIFLFDVAGDAAPCSGASPLPALDETLASVLEGCYDGIIIIENNRIAKINSSLGRITGLRGESVIDKEVCDLNGETHVCLHTIQEVVRLVQQFRKSITSMGKLKKGNEIYVTGTPVLSGGDIRYIIVNVRDITELQLLRKEVSRLMALYLSAPEETRIKQIAGEEIIAENHIMRGVMDLVARVAQVDTTVFLEGESGTGKELLARLIHRLSARSNEPLIPVNCGAIPENLFESELFGYAKGAFTGASKDGKCGLFELADKGIIFLDEIAELPPNCQVKLLKVLEDMEVMRVGGVSPIKLDVRIIAATNRNLKKLVDKGEFREDLYYRLYVVPIEIPPLRNRREDIFPIAWHYLCKYNDKFNQSKTFSNEIIQVMESYPWPGNVRELQNVVERMVITIEEEILQPHHLPRNIYSAQKSSDASMIQVKGIMSLSEARETLERKLLSHAMSLKKTSREAARLLGVDHSTVVRKLKKYNLRQRDEAARE